MRETDQFVFFYKSWLGQWSITPFFDFNGVDYNSAEQYMMAEKARIFGDEEKRAIIMKLDHSRDQQAIGRTISNFNQTTWDLLSDNVIFLGNLFKFTQHPNLKAKLLATGTKILVEASPIDTIYGVGLSEDDPLILDPKNWKGQNKLGQCLVKVRETIKNFK